MSTKRPRTELSLCKKYDIVKELNGGAKQADVAKKYGINESTVSRIKKERQSISKKFETGEKNPKQKRNRNIGFADVDQALYNWVVSTASGLPGLSGQMLLEKARKLARDLHYDDDDKIDLNWINRFKSRHMVYAAKNYGLKGRNFQAENVQKSEFPFWLEHLRAEKNCHFSPLASFSSHVVSEEAPLLSNISPTKKHG